MAAPMKQTQSSSAHPYIAVIPQVREVTLLGSADLAFWQGQLAREGLAPTPVHQRAQLVLSAPDLRWSGIRFQELSLGVTVGRAPGGEPSTGLYLTRAYNSSRLLAFLERTLFQTPYAYQATQVTVARPASFTVRSATGTSLRASMALSAQLLWSRDETWEGIIFLPTPVGVTARQRQFSAKLGGLTEAYAFDPAADSFFISPTTSDPLLRLLIESQFVPEEWRIRTSATHARSRTYVARPEA